MDGLLIAEDAKMLTTLKELIVEHVAGVESLDQVADDSDLADLGLDSMAGLNLLLDMEEEFQVQFPEEYLTAEVFSSPMSLASAIKTISSDQ